MALETWKLLRVTFAVRAVQILISVPMLDEQLGSLTDALRRLEVALKHAKGVAEHGYVYEHNHAFYPAVPFVASWISKLGVVVMHFLSLKVLRSESDARNAAVFFILQVCWFKPGCHSAHLQPTPRLSLRKLACASRQGQLHWARMLMGAFSLVLQCGVVVSGHLAFSLFGNLLYCKSDFAILSALQHNFRPHPPQDPRPWCNQLGPYRFVQQTYWGVGFLEYFEFNLYEVLSGSSGGTTGKSRKALGTSSGLNLDTLPYVAHAAFLAIFAFFFINVQVSTRLLCSSCPSVFWFLAALTHRSQVAKDPLARKLVAIYCCFFSIYASIGCVLFSTFLPWT
ncbi:hypothetical protein GUITHDRAFT_164715 [Guillardia theta CCMP2712]|uniref:GPI mannosyltransferase 2 n=1 Tax=Guillardia theta (strain CCMP2712) TaxID=905079 RepID=L1IWY1_GUITC|nr:hypothetical protein GUITHDRAFT_164715 [Guillardia theta CCMP2712]EKX40379.1 hypothetical protein GUITHDRAFT_164715 [Guillardia theta CCMP2712]|eukprot:XP_005827359.1 hypothetical protein GUITHDRAFT_164715 [Guillardia theta CCMP2712]